MTNVNAKGKSRDVCPASTQCQNPSSQTSEPKSEPKVERSALTNCTYIHLTSSTRIERSSLNGTTITGTPGHAKSRSVVERSSIDRGRLTDCAIERSQLSRTDVSGGKIERSALSTSELSEQCVVERSSIKDCKIQASRIERSALTGCEVRSAKVSRCAFTNMVIMNGKWERNKLVGSEKEKMEAVEMKKAEWEKKLEDGWTPDDTKGYLIELEMPTEEPPQYTLPTRGSKEMPIDEKRAESLIESNGSYSRATGMAEFELELEAYNGPELENPPPYRE